jgi:O-antigen/teichoic acid export membrane protein
MSKLAAAGDDAGVILLYRNATQLVGVIAIPAAMVLAFFAEQVLWAWTGDADIARKAAPVLTLYALGNGILALGAFPYYLQFAKGDLRLHMMGNGFFVVLLIPTLIWATLHYGVVGAGCAWLGANAVYFLAWVPKVHSRFVKGLHTQWLLRDVGAIVLLTALGAALTHSLVSWPHERAQLALEIAVVSLAMVAMAAAGSSLLRERISSKWLARIAAQG